jgi:hypothetical protein
MASGKKGGSGAGGIFLFIALAVLLAITIITPYLMLICALFYGVIANREIKVVQRNGGFYVPNSSRQELDGFYYRINELDHLIDKEHSKAINNNVSKNKDGSYSLRSKVGKEINASLSTLEPEMEALMQDYNNHPMLPINQWNDFNGVLRKAYALFASILTFAGSIVAFWLWGDREAVLEVFRPFYSIPYNLVVDKADLIAGHPDDLWVVGVSAAVAIATCFFVNEFFDEPANIFVDDSALMLEH